MQAEVRRDVRWIALDNHVIAVACEGYANDWTAYIGAVPGNNHYQEWEEVMRHGSKLRRDVAEILFPDFAAKFSWRE